MFAVPPGIHSPYIKYPVADVSVNPIAFGKFMCRIHELWSCKDKGRLHIQMFDVAEEKQRTGICGLCTMDMVCGHSICIEQDGNVYSCDRYAFPEYLLGNIKKESLGVLAEKNRQFGMSKTLSLPLECISCEYVKLCAGGCPKDRIILTDDQGKRKNYLCEGYKMIYAKLKNNKRI